MSVLLIGCNGSMGQRYSAILRHLNRSFVGVDRECAPRELTDLALDSNRIIIATPTQTHIDLILFLGPLQRPILCEKPIATNLADTLKLCTLAERENINLRMVNQYEHLPHDGHGRTYYDYYRHGSDSLRWDCINIIGLAQDVIELRETSPVWQCTINGNRLTSDVMDYAYVDMLTSWLEDPQPNIDYIREAHGKVAVWG